MRSNLIAAKQIASLMLEIRQISKELSTYYSSVEELVYPDGFIHSQFNHCATQTGRLSCSKPNVQNSPASEDTKVPEHFVSRFWYLCEMRGLIPNGVLISADYKSLEVRIEAQLSGDIQYISDIINGVDFHVKNLALKNKDEYETVQARIQDGDVQTINDRSKIKGFTFATQYGAGNKKIAEMTGFTEEEVQGIKEARRKAYPRLHMYYDWMQSEVNRTGQYSDPWGRVYKFKKYPPKFKWQKQDSYSPNEIQNFRSQGYATGTIVLSMLGRFWREKALHNRHIRCEHPNEFVIKPMQYCLRCEDTGYYDKYLLINTIHDSVMLDCKKEFESDARKDLTILCDVGTLSKELFDYDFIVPIEIDIVSGNSWGDL